MSVAHRPVTERSWFKSSYSGGNATECVECAFAGSGTLIRDSKRVNGPVIRVAAGPWLTFVRALPQRPVR
ncbi:DUF397 domain-containing protein [Streptomyces fungicidicus]|uniref:DUF397 domain-containing protein n=1 Tax=Streptomyces fungicidicus TaxID=68203 RepID=UPI0033264B13